jgi:molybdopterin/thiamine biosynthesis adenylyltransferase/rhodanese-related sulfurtransferase
MPLPELTQHEIYRYSRHLILPHVGVEGQRRLKSARVLIVGAGGLGSPAALYLAAAGVGRIGLVDFDTVDETNLQRQILHGTAAVGRSKLESAAERLRDLNPHVDLVLHEARLTSANAMGLLRDWDVVVDGSDNFPTRYLVNDACVFLGIPYVYGAVFRFDGQVSLFATLGGPCYRCLFRDPPPPELVPSCDEAGVLGVVPGIIGTLQALEAVKLLMGAGEPLAGRLILFDALTTAFRELTVHRDPACPVCGDAPTIRELIDYEAFCGVTPVPAAASLEVTAAELAREMEANRELLLVDVREPMEWEVCRIEPALLVPLGSLEDRLGEIDRQRDVVMVCHHGVRSLRAALLMRNAGFSRVRSLRGGVAAWADHVDPAMPRY